MHYLSETSSNEKDYLKLFLERTSEQTEKFDDILFAAEEILAEVCVFSLCTLWNTRYAHGFTSTI